MVGPWLFWLGPMTFGPFLSPFFGMVWHGMALLLFSWHRDDSP